MAMRNTLIIFLFFTLYLIPLAISLPFVFLHGLGNACKPTDPNFEQLETYSGAQGYCIEIGDGMYTSIFMPIIDQVKIACDKIKESNEFKEGFNLVGQSQGNMISRGVIELCDDAPPVKNYISLAGPQAGISAMPSCQILPPKLRPLCEDVESYINSSGIYNQTIQANFAPSNYMKLPNEIEAYLAGSTFLPKISNEIESTRNSTYKERFASLQNLVLVMNIDENVLIPKETSLFGFYKDGSNDTVVTAEETLLYKEDWIGLRKLNEDGKVTQMLSPGAHVEYTSEFLRDCIAPYLKHQTTEYTVQVPTYCVQPNLKHQTTSDLEQVAFA